ncbi:MAG TPA: T9SS type A sorting domain-containing protein, partial [Caldithrix sp.]|nr:T9SS type A sorting domain-containing protein [Caldithrix sp.]
AGNLPGNDLIPPIDSTFVSANTWVDVLLPQPVTGLYRGDVVFAGVELSAKSIGYNDTNTPGFSFIKTGAIWQRLSEREFQGGEKADGVWMIRAAFSGLVSSDSLKPSTENETFVLRGNYPNPVNPLNREITIEFYAPQAGDVRFQAFNVLGQKVADFRQSVAREGINSILWRGNGSGRILSSGVYFYRLIYQNPFTGKKEKSKFRKIVLVK